MVPARGSKTYNAPIGAWKDTALNEVTTKESLGIIYGMDDKPPLWQSAVTAAQHLMSMAISIGAPPLLICQALNMPPDITIYLVNMSFLPPASALLSRPTASVPSAVVC